MDMCFFPFLVLFSLMRFSTFFRFALILVIFALSPNFLAFLSAIFPALTGFALFIAMTCFTFASIFTTFKEALCAFLEACSFDLEDFSFLLLHSLASALSFFSFFAVTSLPFFILISTRRAAIACFLNFSAESLAFWAASRCFFLFFRFSPFSFVTLIFERYCLDAFSFAASSFRFFSN